MARRTTTAAVHRKIKAMLIECLPAGWTFQAMPASAGEDDDQARAQADFLVISPRGRCSFLFAKAPADRWWDGDLRHVSAQPLTPQEAALIARLKQAGHGARAVWNLKAAVRALAAWGCPLDIQAALRSPEVKADKGAWKPPGRRKLTLGLTGRGGYGQ